jgi:hypothetical protein
VRPRDQAVKRSCSAGAVARMMRPPPRTRSPR